MMERRDKLDSININDLFRSKLYPIPPNTDNKKQKWKHTETFGENIKCRLEHFLMVFAAENFKTRSIVFLNLSNCTECTEVVVYFLKCRLQSVGQRKLLEA